MLLKLFVMKAQVGGNIEKEWNRDKETKKGGGESEECRKY